MKATMIAVEKRMRESGDIHSNDVQVILLAIYKLLEEMETTQQSILEQLKKSAKKN